LIKTKGLKNRGQAIQSVSARVQGGVVNMILLTPFLVMRGSQVWILTTRHLPNGQLPATQSTLISIPRLILYVSPLWQRLSTFSKYATIHIVPSQSLSTECFKEKFTMIFKMLLCDECYENVYSSRYWTSFRVLNNG
jgi:hypothetical protein